MSKHAASDTQKATTNAARMKTSGINSAGVRFATWAETHPTLSALGLGIACFLGLFLVFYFVVFSDFGSSADFIYNQF